MNLFKKRLLKRILAIVLVITTFSTTITIEKAKKAYASAPKGYTTIYFKDDTKESWIGNDGAIIQLVDNTDGHDYYIMKQVDDNTWSCRVPAKTYNVTFNRLSPKTKDGKQVADMSQVGEGLLSHKDDNYIQWNSWSAGGRGSNRDDYSSWHSTYHATVPEHGYWDGTMVIDNDYFHEGDVIYLDFYEFTSDNNGSVIYNWEQSNAQFYINFNKYSKSDNGGRDINIKNADKDAVSPIKLTDSPETQVFRYVVTKEDEGATELRFFRGNDENLWNESVLLRYSDYKQGNNCAKVKGWDNNGYVCPYVPRRHMLNVYDLVIKTDGNLKVNRKVDIDLELDAPEGEEDYLNKENTVIEINKIDSDGNVIAGSKDIFLFDDSKTEWNHRELIFKEAGSYKISASVTDGYDTVNAEKIITVAKDNAPLALINLSADEGENTDNEDVFVRNSNGKSNITVCDESSSEIGDEINYRHYILFYDSDNDNIFDDTEIIDERDGDGSSFNYELDNVGKYKIVLNVKETFTDTIPSLIDDSVYLSGNTEKVFEITNQAPKSKVTVEKSKIADIIFTVGSADKDVLNAYSEASKLVEDKLKEKGIEANITTVSTSAITATDTFAWKEYDHPGFNDWGYVLPHHIQYTGKDIKMVGYYYAAFKDFLYVEDNNPDRKVFDFDLQRDGTDWHSMEGGGFLFNTVVSEEENYIQGYCILVTSSGLKLVKINKTNLTNFRNGSYEYVQYAGKLLQTFPISNVYANHHFKIIIEDNVITVYDGDKIIINQYVLEDDGVAAYGYGPIISHENHGCYQQSYFTFKNIVMQTISGESLSDVVNKHQWTPGTNHYVINLSDAVIPELSDNGRTANVAAALLSKDVKFYGIGNDVSISSYNRLVDIIDNNGENTNISVSKESGKTQEEIVTEAVNHIVADIESDVLSKDYIIGNTISTDEKVEYKGTYSDAENDNKGNDEWTYIYNPTIFDNDGEQVTFIQSEPMTMFENVGAYAITHRVSDDPTKGNSALAGYVKWSDTDEVEKLIVAQTRPVAEIKADIMQSDSDSKKCITNILYSAYDSDHLSDAKKGIIEEKFYYKEINDTKWTEGRFPAQTDMGKTYLVKYIVKDYEGTYSRPAVISINTNDARVYTKPDDKEPPKVTLSVSKTEVNIGESVYIEGYAEDNFGISTFEIKCNDDVIGSGYNRYEFKANEAGVITISAIATDIAGNVTTETKTITVIDNRDVTPPEIIITEPKDGIISGIVEIKGSITDDRKLKGYKVTRTKTGDENSEEVLVAEGSEAIVNAVIGTINTDELEEGVYCYRITAEDEAGLTAEVSFNITVEKEEADKIPPVTAFTKIALDAENKNIVIEGSVSDETKLSEYTLTYFNKANESVKIIIVKGYENVENAELGTISTEGLSDGTYEVELSAIDAAGNTCVSKAEFTYTAGHFVENDDKTAPDILADLDAVIENKVLKIKLTGSITDEHLKEYKVTTGKKEDNKVIDEVVIATGNSNIDNAEIAAYEFPEYSVGEYEVKVVAKDEAGNTRTTTYTFTVYEDGRTNIGGNNENQEIALVFANTIANAGDTVAGYISYPKNTADISVTSDDADVTLDGKKVSVTKNEAGLANVTFTAMVDGELKSVTKQIRFFDRSDNIHPTAEFITPEADSDLKTKTDIIGTVKDETSLAYYTLEYKLNGTDDYVEIAKGYESIENGKVGELDTTMLMNGSYTLKLTAVDNGGNRSTTERIINVTGNLKVGNMALGFTDISSNVSGVPLQVNRNYDSRNKSFSDFGYGWSLGMQSVKITLSNPLYEGYNQVQKGSKLSTSYYIEQTLNHDITVTYGDGTSDKFSLKLLPDQRAWVPIDQVQIKFVCETDKTKTLEIDGDNTAFLQGSNLYFEDINLLDIQDFVLTTKEGTKMYLSPAKGLTKASDANGNVVNISKNGFTHSDGYGINFTRDSKGRIISATETDSKNNVINSIKYGYDDNGDLVLTTDYAGRDIIYSYDDDHNLTEILDPSGKPVARNEYDENGRLKATVDSNGNRIEYEHDIDAKMEVVRDRNGNPTVFYYDDNGNVIKTVDALGNSTTNKYDADNKLIESTDANGNVTKYERDKDGNLKTLILPDGTKEELKYNDLNIVNSIKLDDKLLVSMDYDSKGNITGMSDALGNKTDLTYEKDGKLSSISDEIGQVKKLKYDENGNLISLEDGNKNSTTYEYDEKNRCTGVTVTRIENGEQKEYTSRYVYDKAGNITSKISNTGMVTTYEYDYKNNVTAAVSSDGLRTEYTYDSEDNLTYAAYSDGTSETFEYDKNGNNIKATDRYGITVSMEYDVLNRLTTKTYADGTKEKYTYDANGNVLTFTSVSGGVTEYTYDNMNRNTSVKDAYGNVTTFTYNNRSKLVKTKDAKGNIFKYEYDDNDRQIAEIYPDGTKEQTEYDKRGRVSKQIDRNGNVTKYEYDGADNLIAVEDATGNKYSYTYDETYELTKVTDANGNATLYSYDEEGRLIKTTNASGKSAEFKYDENGYQTSFVDYAGNEVTYSYDNLGRLVKKNNKDGDVNITYDSLGRLSKVTDSKGDVIYTYDEYNRLASKTTYDLGTIKYTYADNEEISSITYNVNGEDVAATSYSYDLMDRLVKVIDHNGVATVYEYDSLGNRTKVKHEGGLTVSYKYDVCSRLINEIVTDKDSNVLMFYDYSYGKAGEKTKAVEITRESSESTTVRVIKNEYKYDELLRLTEEKISINDSVDFDDVINIDSENITLATDTITYQGTIENKYAYDKVSNRTGKTTKVTGNVDDYTEDVETGNTIYTYNELNQLIKSETVKVPETESFVNASETNADILTINYTYDDNGNLTSEHGTKDKTYTYDAENKLLTATVSSGNAVTIESYTYDYEGNRISKQVNEEEKVFYLNDTYTSLTQVALELTKNTDNTYKVNKYYTRGLELISADINNNELFNHKIYIQDGHGSVTALVENSKITDTYTYDSYGIMLKKTGDTDNDYLYTGEQYNESTGLYYLRARYMSPETGTFTTMDTYAGTLDNPVSLHKYLYANGNPVMYTDPTGNFSLMETSVAQGIQATINTIITPGFSLQKMLTLANLAVTAYDVATTIRMVFCGEATVLDVALCIVKGLVVQSLISCVATAVFGEAAAFMLKLVGIGQDTYGLIEAIKSKDPKEIAVATVRLAVSVFTLKSQCFTGDTLVSTEEGNRRIDEIKPGDKVLSYNTETGENELQEVKNVSVSKTDILVHIITDDGRDIETTMFHPFYVKNVKNEDGTGEWKAASNLKAGDELLSEDGNKVKVSEVKVEKLAEEITVYNLELDEVHTYYVAGGVLVHNMCATDNNSDTSDSEGGKNTKHGEQRLAERGFSQEKVDDIVNNYSQKVYQDGGRTVYAKKNGNYYDVIIKNSKGEIVTAVGGNTKSLKTWKNVIRMLNNNGGYSSLPMN